MRRSGHGSRSQRRGAQRLLHGALGVALALPTTGARAADAAADDAAATQDVQSLYESCLRQLDEGAAATAANCLWEVYRGLVAIDKIARTDLYYVLADTVAASQTAAVSDPQALCLARRLLDDWAERERRVPQIRFRSKVRKMSAAIDAAMKQAGVQADACEARLLEEPGGRAANQIEVATPTPTPTDATPTDATPTDATPTDATPTDATPTDATPTDATPKRAAGATIKPTAPRPAVPPRRATRKLGTTAKTDLLDAGFIITFAGVGTAGLGGALWALAIECRARPECRDTTPVPQGVRDAGLALMSIGAAGVIVGLALRYADQRRQRKLRQAPTPTFGTSSVGLSWRAEF